MEEEPPPLLPLVHLQGGVGGKSLRTRSTKSSSSYNSEVSWTTDGLLLYSQYSSRSLVSLLLLRPMLEKTNKLHLSSGEDVIVP